MDSLTVVLIVALSLALALIAVLVWKMQTKPFDAWKKRNSEFVEWLPSEQKANLRDMFAFDTRKITTEDAPRFVKRFENRGVTP